MNRQLTRKHNQLHRRVAHRAFTLLEIMVVVTIIAVLATLIVPRIWGALSKSKTNAARAEASSIAKAVGLWMMDNGHSSVPDDFELEMLLEGDQPYLNNKDALMDPWEHPYVIRVGDGTVNHDYDIVSLGADGEEGGEGEDTDVVHE
jgi:general secretion pathway protein G